MITLRPAGERGHADHGWLDTRHSFSFANYYDPEHMGYGPLRVINEDRVAGGGGFPPHPHRDMEILTYVLEGALEHRDSMGNGSVIRPGEVQRMSAGTGVVHSEMNPSAEDSVHLLQIWILPERAGLRPSYEQRAFDLSGGGLTLLASREAREGSVAIHRDVDLYAARLGPGGAVGHSFAPGRIGWLQVARGNVDLDGKRLEAGDGAAIADLAEVKLAADEAGAELLLFDMAA
ncbi:MAG: pirin family protein [Alphaproteobacteria bacterium]|nr:pirin family protein [Alphaproteobacteria bacterium]